MLAAAFVAASRFYRAATSGSQNAWEQMLGGGLFCGTLFSMSRPIAPRKFSGNSRDSLLNFLSGLRIKTRHVNHPGEDGSNVTAVNQTRRQKIAAQGIGKCGDVASSHDVMGDSDLRSSLSSLVL